MGLPPSCVTLNAACPSEPILCLLDRAGLWGTQWKVLVDLRQTGTYCSLYRDLIDLLFKFITYSDIKLDKGFT